MIVTTARVVAADNGRTMVEPSNESGCGGCKSRSVCGVSGLGKYFSGNRKAIEVQCDASVTAGDELQLSMSEGDMLKAGLLAYLLPSVMALAGAGIASAYGWGDAGAVLGAAGGVAAGLLMGRLTGWVPHILAQRKNEYSSKGETP
ncbi:SoxR reducing system RseC family protein [Sideroxydans lithotrophicus]|uniref:Positive regulator of sigma E, RseC/MucC n=1 Tax=Sideroxydans lithotrophicus (strain ES-1) TaxID=580332 RepID=D5CPY0_SIDLE|nr:SoxR reducing system RseC family protein [Sideroxydans lithotrophicus]ADE11144.1 positive regulator of sigma E, RseC/MucC [Sideroxydans lithotrophicus ES-1]